MYIIHPIMNTSLPRPPISVRSAVVAHVSWAHGVAGSNPAAQTNSNSTSSNNSSTNWRY